MFNLFRNKHKRSYWLEGLLFAEQHIQDGETPDDNLIFWNEDRSVGWAYKTEVMSVCNGVCDYLDYYEGILSKIELKG